jgi:hypothetical protein
MINSKRFFSFNFFLGEIFGSAFASQQQGVRAKD